MHTVCVMSDFVCHYFPQDMDLISHRDCIILPWQFLLLVYNLTKKITTMTILQNSINLIENMAMAQLAFAFLVSLDLWVHDDLMSLHPRFIE